MIKDVITLGAFQARRYGFIIPISLLLIAGLAFALLGFSLDRCSTPTLRTYINLPAFWRSVF
ncbi:MAG: hypothetical protein ROW48_17595 [Bellilinea sp.]